jgi:hypothetical protein
MVLVLVVGGGLGWFIHRATVQRDAVKAIVAAGGFVQYDFQRNAGPRNPRGTPPGPRWLVDLLGVDFFASVIQVKLGGSQTEAILAQVGRLHRLQRLNASAIGVSDAGLAHLAGLSELSGLSCRGTPGLTDAGLARLTGLAQLDTLRIEGPAAIQGPGLAHLAGLNRLEFLWVRIETDAGLPSLTRLTGLRWLSISLPKVTDASIVQISRLTQLEELAFGGETGSDAEMARLRALTNLHTLEVHGPWFTDAGLAGVSSMSPLSAFFLSDETSVTAGGLNRLQRERPELRIGVNETGKVPQARLNLLRGAVGLGGMPTSPPQSKS